MPETRIFLTIESPSELLGDKFSAAFGATTAQHLLSVGSRHTLTKSVSFFSNDISWCF